ncbi:MAG: DUF1893 domain-containing protein [Candidatus Bathyarchaeia archaeon]
MKEKGLSLVIDQRDYAVTLSNEGLKVFEENHVPFEYDSLVPQILDKTGKNIYPFERLSLTTKSPKESHEILKGYIEKSKRKIT